MRRFGLSMTGCEEILERILREHASRTNNYTLIEIGSAGCTTLRAFSDILSSVFLNREFAWRTIGFDLKPGLAWSLDMNEVNISFNNYPKQIFEDWPESCPLGMSLILMENPRLFLEQKFPFNIDFALIDGCHGKCSGLDFLAIEKKVNPLGILVFHDYGQIEQGTEWQSHCREFINVRTYIHRLGLAKPCNEIRKGWRFIGEIPGSRARGLGGDGSSCAVIQRTLEPLEYQPALSID